MPSVINGSDNFNSAYGAALKAWVNFNGVSTASIRASLGVSSVTRNSVGDYTINFSTAMADTNYVVSAMTSNEYGSYGALMTFAGPSSGQSRATYQQTTSCRVFSMNVASTASVIDKETVCLAFFR